MRSSVRFSWVLLALLVLCTTTRAAEDEHPTLAVGSPAPDFALPGIDGKVHRLHDYDASPVLAIIFTCNHCPTAQLYESRIKKLVDDFGAKGVAFVGIQPNDPKAIRLSELGYTDVSDSLEEMKTRSAYRHFNFPYLYDGDTQSVSRAYGPKATPHVFVFDRERKLRYEGHVDDSQRASLVKSSDARNAIDALLAGRDPAVKHTGAFGCSTKWKSKIDSQMEELRKIEAEPVRVEAATADDLKKLRSNPTSKVLLINFWATWCGPCITEFPGLEETFRMFRRRDFDLITVSTNLPDEKTGVTKTLQSQHASSTNLQFATAETYDLQKAFDPSWESGVPFTIVIAPGGKVLYRKEGEVDVLEVRRAILGHLENETYVGHPDYWRGN
jgi:peroxiredoxin